MPDVRLQGVAVSVRRVAHTLESVADDDDKRDSDNEAIAMARAAIAKAKGTK